MRYAITSIDAMYNDIKNLKSFIVSTENQDPIQLNNSIILKDINYHYPNSKGDALKNLNLKIIRTSVGIVGTGVVKLLQLISFLVCLKLNRDL